MASEDCLSPTEFLDWEHPAVQAYAQQAAAGADSPRERVVRLYYRIRDGIRYDPYNFRLHRSWFRASEIVRRDRDYCVPKAVLLAAGARALGVPSRVGFADVRNHLSTEKMRTMMQTDVFGWHGYAELYLDGQWLKATPAFNLSLCEKAGVRPLEFDGTADAIFHEFDQNGRRHMEYLRDHGTFADFPYEAMLRGMAEVYPQLMGPAAERLLREAGGAEDFEQAIAEQAKQAGHSS